MFDSLSEKFTRVLKNLKGQGRLTEENINDGLREVRRALLEADVALSVVRDFIAQVKERALGKDVMLSMTPGQALIKIINEELVSLMGGVNESLNINTSPPAIILLTGLQGAGKTTTAAKLGKLLKEKNSKKIGVVSCDIYRPAAIEQLHKLAIDNDLFWIESDKNDKPADIARKAIDTAKSQLLDVLIVDSAGRLHIDDDMMDEIRSIHNILNPIETLFVIDSMLGQDAVNSASVFNKALPLTGVVLTKMDSDARGGAALTVKYITGKPIKFIGVGEKTDALAAFHPERVASRILGMGDMLSLIEDIEKKTDKNKALELAKNLKKGKEFTLVDFKEQLMQMNKMGGINSLVDKLPGSIQLPKASMSSVNDKEFVKLLAIIDSMTTKEMVNPAVVNGSRKKRIAKGSGTQIQDINRLLKQFNIMKKMMKKFSGKGGMAKMMRGLKNVGNMPMGFRPFK